MTAADSMVEILAERLEVDVGRIHILVELATRLGSHVTCSNRHGLDALLAARFGDVDGILHENGRVVISISHAAAAQPTCGSRNCFRCGGIRERIPFTRLADIPVLAEPAGEIAAYRAEGQDRRPWKIMIQRLLLDRVYAVAAGVPVGCEDDRAVVVGAHETQTALAVVQLA